jgi:hypothetical protein
MSLNENGRDPESGAPAPIFASSWMALLLLLRNEFGNLYSGLAAQELEDGEDGNTLN